MWPFQTKYDAFISHAVEDKLPVANDLCEKLEEAGLKIWYSGKELTVGDSLEKAIHKGLDRSRFGVVILSPTYLEKNWTRREFYTLLAKEINSKTIILPVLYNITPNDLAMHDLTMADRYGLSMDRGMDIVAEKLVAVIKSGKVSAFKKKILRLGLFMAAVFGLVYFAPDLSRTSEVPSQIEKELIEKRLAKLQADFDRQFHTQQSHSHLSPGQNEGIVQQYNAFRSYQSYYRNEYEFTNGVSNIRFKKNVESALNIDLDALSPINSYNLTSPQTYISSMTATDEKDVQYAYVNTQPITYKITKELRVSDNEYVIAASIDNNVRYWLATLQYPTSSGMPKKYKMQILGLLPVEEFRIVKKDTDWTLASSKF